MTTTAPKPTQDLYRHVNGEWMENNTIPADRGTYGAFMELHDQSEIAVHEILKSAAKELSKKQRKHSFKAKHTDEGATLRIGALYTAMMDEKTIEALGVAPLWETLDEISEIDDAKDFLKLTGKLQRKGIVGGPVGVGAMPDAGNPDRVLLHLIQSGLGLPDESYYREDKHAHVVEAYRTYIEKLFLLSELAPTEKRAQKMAKRVIELETKIAAPITAIIKPTVRTSHTSVFEPVTARKLFMWITGQTPVSR